MHKNDNYKRAVQANPEVANEPTHLDNLPRYVKELRTPTAEDLAQMVVRVKDLYGVYQFLRSEEDIQVIELERGICSRAFQAKAYGFCYSHNLPARPRRRGDFLWYERIDRTVINSLREVW